MPTVLMTPPANAPSILFFPDGSTLQLTGAASYAIPSAWVLSMLQLGWSLVVAGVAAGSSTIPVT